MATNRFQYYIRNNEFTNIGTCINIPIAAGSFSTISGGNQAGIFADRILITQNTIAIGTSTNNYVNYGVNISWLNNSLPHVANEYSVGPYEKEIRIEENSMTDVYRGVYVNGVTNFLTQIKKNDISLRSDNIYNISQHAVDVSNTFGSSANLPEQIVVHTNTLSSPATTTLESLVYSGSNAGFNSPSITCNYLTTGSSGFVFDQSNPLSIWQANVMEPLEVGLDLRNNGTLGAQGNTFIASNNEWANSWTGKWHTRTDNSFAVASPLFIRPIPGLEPILNDGLVQQDYNSSGSIFTVSPQASDFDCDTEPTNRAIPLPDESDERYSTAESFFIDQNKMYRFLHFNDSLREEEPFNNYYENLAGTSIEYLMQAEEYLVQGDYTSAQTILTSITATNAVEEVYISFYSIYSRYLMQLAEDENLTADDSVALWDLGKLCAGLSGNAVYQARSLYNFIYGVQIPFYDCEISSFNRIANQNPLIAKWRRRALEIAFEIFPNPAESKIIIKVSDNSTQAELTILDLAGQVLVTKALTFQNRQAHLDLDLPRGCYMANLKTRNNVFNKLLVIQ